RFDARLVALLHRFFGDGARIEDRYAKGAHAPAESSINGDVPVVPAASSLYAQHRIPPHPTSLRTETHGLSRSPLFHRRRPAHRRSEDHPRRALGPGDRLPHRTHGRGRGAAARV